MKGITLATLLCAGSLVAAPVLADTPVSIEGPHGHGVEVTGKVTMFRAQEKGLELGSKKDFLDAEVLVTLDSQPGKVFGIKLHDQQDPAAVEMIDTLRAAYLNNKKVTIQHRIAPGQNHLKVIWVQLGSPSQFASDQ